MVCPPLRGAIGASTLSPVRRAHRPLAAALLLLTGCARTSMDNVPTMGVRACKVSVKDLHTNVVLRCGPPCGGGDTPTGRCDVYHHVLVCYGADERVATLRQLAPYNDQFAWCNWK